MSVAERAPRTSGARIVAFAAARVLPLPLIRIAGASPTPRTAQGPEESAVRWSRVMAVRARIATGFYDRHEIRASLADAVLRELQRP